MSSPPRVPPSLIRGCPLKNVTCPYCAAALDPETRTKEHVIGRRFVPKGSTENRWNLILWACSVCNNKKSDLEDDIAAITMYLHTTGLASTEDPTARAEAIRGGPKSGSRETGNPVADSHSSLNSPSQLGPVEMTFGFVAPPQRSRSVSFGRQRGPPAFGCLRTGRFRSSCVTLMKRTAQVSNASLHPPATAVFGSYRSRANSTLSYCFRAPNPEVPKTATGRDCEFV
jgi:hypothetical protein